MDGCCRAMLAGCLVKASGEWRRCRSAFGQRTTSFPSPSRTMQSNRCPVGKVSYIGMSPPFLTVRLASNTEYGLSVEGFGSLK